MGKLASMDMYILYNAQDLADNLCAWLRPIPYKLKITKYACFKLLISDIVTKYVIQIQYSQNDAELDFFSYFLSVGVF